MKWLAWEKSELETVSIKILILTVEYCLYFKLLIKEMGSITVFSMLRAA